MACTCLHADELFLKTSWGDGSDRARRFEKVSFNDLPADNPALCKLVEGLVHGAFSLRCKNVGASESLITQHLAAMADVLQSLAEMEPTELQAALQGEPAKYIPKSFKAMLSLMEARKMVSYPKHHVYPMCPCGRLYRGATHKAKTCACGQPRSAATQRVHYFGPLDVAAHVASSPAMLAAVSNLPKHSPAPIMTDVHHATAWGHVDSHPVIGETRQGLVYSLQDDGVQVGFRSHGPLTVLLLPATT